MTFTFHYELIITVEKCFTHCKLAIFTFHYELIITTTDNWASMATTAIYISL